jgi:CelD/BcsL family acetyltransferase involved in cellulose biosynthesis
VTHAQALPGGCSVEAAEPEGWRELVAADRSASPSHAPGLWAALAAALPAFEWRVLVLREAGDLVAGVPLVLERRGPFRWLHALPWLLPAPPVARPGGHARADLALAAAFATLAACERAVGGAWSWYRPEGPEPAPEALALVPGETRRFEAATLPLAAGTEPLRARMDRKQRQALEHALARRATFAEEPGALDEAFALHLRQSAGWPGHRPLPLELSRRLLRPAADDAPSARLFTLREGGELVSATLALDGAHETFVWWSGTHERARRTSAFARLLWSVAEWAAARGRRRLDLGASTGLPHVAAFKRSLGATGVRYPVRWLDARAAGLAGRGLARLQGLLRRGRARGERA